LAIHSGSEADHSPPSSAEVKEWVDRYIHSPSTPSWRGVQLGRTQGRRPCAMSLVQLPPVENLPNAFLVLFTDTLFSPLVAIPVVTMISGMPKHFIFHIR
jgi:hypothetical protein